MKDPKILDWNRRIAGCEKLISQTADRPDISNAFLVDKINSIKIEKALYIASSIKV